LNWVLNLILGCGRQQYFYINNTAPTGQQRARTDAGDMGGAKSFVISHGSVVKYALLHSYDFRTDLDSNIHTTSGTSSDLRKTCTISTLSGIAERLEYIFSPRIFVAIGSYGLMP